MASIAFQQAFGEEAEIVATVICGDTYFKTWLLPDEVIGMMEGAILTGHLQAAFNAGAMVSPVVRWQAVVDRLVIPGFRYVSGEPRC